MVGFFKARDFPPEIIDLATKRVNRIKRDVALKEVPVNNSSDRIPLVLPFHPSVYPIRRIIYKHYNTLMTDPSTSAVFQNIPNLILGFIRF